MSTERRDFLKASLSLSTLPAIGWLGGKAQAAEESGDVKFSTFKGLKKDKPEIVDRVDVPKGFEWNVLAKRGDVINKAGEKFGDCCDFTHFVKGDSQGHGFLWVNHEYVVPALLHGRAIDGKDKSKKMVDLEMGLVGGSYIEISKKQGRWSLVKDSTKAFRLDGNTEIPLVGAAGGRKVYGTMGNCAGGSTPWGTVLSCEENTNDYYDPNHKAYYGWGEHYPRSTEDYGWVVEVDVDNKKARKLTGLGRFAHEGATTQIARNKKMVVYLGDDARFQCLYKFVSRGVYTGDPKKDKDLLVDGTLYVANLKKARWEELSPNNRKLMEKSQGKFKTLKDILVHTREAANFAGGTPLNRPEGIVVDPKTGQVLISLTNNSKAGDFFGSILAIEEKDGDHTSMNFSFSNYVAGGPDVGFACPDNLAIGPKDSIWVATDISGSSLGKGAYENLTRNGFFRLEKGSDESVEARCLFQSPIDAEVTGPCFHPDGKSLFLSVQHPGELSYNGNRGLTSHWPLGAGKTPLSAVVTVEASKASFV